jgi:hypothetical protein
MLAKSGRRPRERPVIMWAISVLWIAALATACSIERAHLATEAQSEMVGLAKEQVLACMGPPAAN